MGFELSAENAVPYLVQRGLLALVGARDVVAESLGGGVSNIVIKVSGGRIGDDGWVLKQSLPKLRVEEDWFADQGRIHRERAGIDYLVRRRLSMGGARPEWDTPRVVDEDPDNFVFVMTAAPQGGVNWKEQLLGGEINAMAAERVGSMLGEIHRASIVVGPDAPDEWKVFDDLDCFVQLRIDPYHRSTAAAHPDLACTIEQEAQKMLPRAGERRTLVHGDFSPKNIIVHGGGSEARVFLLDFEVVHLGNPVFDLAFMLNHLTLKAIYRPELASRFCRAASAFWSGYLAAVGDGVVDPERIERDTVKQMGALLLARIDGKSPAEYITLEEQKRRARETAYAILTDEILWLSDLHRRLDLQVA